MSVTESVRGATELPARNPARTLFGSSNRSPIWEVREFVSYGNDAPEFENRDSLEFVKG
jgi:hypothetical protein